MGKYNKWVGDKNYRANKVHYSEYTILNNQLKKEISVNDVPAQINLEKGRDNGFFFGVKDKSDTKRYVGIRQGTEGNIFVVGGNGSGKSAGIAKNTLVTWSGAICATDIKGELSAYYKCQYQQGNVTRPFIIFDPFRSGSIGYDPFYLCEQDSEQDLISHIKEIASAIIPISCEDIQPFWVETEQGIFAAALLHYFKLGLSFSETMTKIVSSTITELVRDIQSNGGELEKMFLGEVKDMKPETLATLDRGLRNKIMLFATDPYISRAFRGKREGADCFTWEDLDNKNIFLCIPEERIEQWGGAINLMYTQLIRHMERRPDKYSACGANNIQTLLMLDEFARFGKLEIMTSAISTLRSKCVNICLIVQSIAQLDKAYGVFDRRIIMDNCQYQAILRANDAETQKYCSELIGRYKGIVRSFGENWDEDTLNCNYSRQISEVLEWKIQPHEFATLKDILLLTPDGFCRVEKVLLQDNAQSCLQKSAPITIVPKEVRVVSKQEDLSRIPNLIRNVRVIAVKDNESENDKEEFYRMPTIEENIKNTNNRVEELRKQQRAKIRVEQENYRKKNQRRNYIIGALVTKYFPELMYLEPGTNTENEERFKSLESILSVLAMDKALVKQLKEKAYNINCKNG